MLKAASWLAILGLVILTVVPANEHPVTGIEHHWEHFTAFALVGFLFALAYVGYVRMQYLGAILFTLALELSKSHYRPVLHARFEDFVVDALGACLRIASVHAFRNLMKRSLGRRKLIENCSDGSGATDASHSQAF